MAVMMRDYLRRNGAGFPGRRNYITLTCRTAQVENDPGAGALARAGGVDSVAVGVGVSAGEVVADRILLAADGGGTGGEGRWTAERAVSYYPGAGLRSNVGGRGPGRAGADNQAGSRRNVGTGGCLIAGTRIQDVIHGAGVATFRGAQGIGYNLSAS
jgi:hypothetical protein